MPKYEGGLPLNNQMKKVAASATTQQISVAGDAVAGRDYLERVIITAASTAAPGVVTVFDGTTSIFAHQFVPAGMASLVQEIPVGIVSDSTKGFVVTTGTSVSVACIGRFS